LRVEPISVNSQKPFAGPMNGWISNSLRAMKPKIHSIQKIVKIVGPGIYTNS
jgi:hypothetical protein